METGMKSKVIFILLFSITILFLTCQEEGILAPASGPAAPEAAFLAKDTHTEFTGKSIFTGRTAGVEKLLPKGKLLVKGEISFWKDDATDPRACGQSIWYIRKEIDPDGSARVWGKGELITDYNGGGKWEMSWHGRVQPGADFPRIIDYVMGIGKEGSVEGLVGKWVYISVKNPEPGFPFIYQVSGYIVDK